MNRKGFLNIIIAVIVAAVLTGGVYYFVNKKTNQSVNPIADDFIYPTSPADWVTIRNKYNPIIESITPTSGPVGTVLEIKGKDLTQYNGYMEGFLLVVFERSDNKEAYLDIIAAGGDVIKVNIDSEKQACGSDGHNKESGLLCDYVELTPGVYKIHINTAYSEDSNVVEFTITTQTTQVDFFPIEVGQCQQTTVAAIEFDSWREQYNVSFSNKGLIIINSTVKPSGFAVGDPINFCYVGHADPSVCEELGANPGDLRPYVYRAKDLNTGAEIEGSPNLHVCSGA